MSFSEKTLVVSGCSHTAGGGIDAPQHWDNVFSKEESSYLRSVYLDGDELSYNFFSDVLFKKVWPYHLHKKLKTKELYNLAKGGGGNWSALQRLYRFIHEQIDDPKNTIIIYQITDISRVELLNTFSDGEQWFGSQMQLSEYDNKLFETFYKHFYNDAFSYYKLIMDLFNFKKYCESLGIEVYFLDWDKQVRYLGPKLTKEYKNNSTINDYWGFYTEMHGIYKVDLKKYTSQLDIICTNEFWNQYVDEMEIKINDGKRIVDHHLNLKGSKLMANFIFEKKFQKSLDN